MRELLKSSKSSKKQSKQNSNKEPRPIDLEAEYEKYIDYLLGAYGKDEYPDPNTYRHHKRTIKCMANKCKPDITNYLEADIRASQYRRTCKSPFDKSCIKTIKNKFNPIDKFAKLTSCKTNKCITKKQMLEARQAYLDQEPTQQCMSKNCDKSIADFRANKILAKEAIRWQCNKDNQTQYKQDLCAVKEFKRMLKHMDYKNMRRASDKCFQSHCANTNTV